MVVAVVVVVVPVLVLEVDEFDGDVGGPPAPGVLGADKAAEIESVETATLFSFSIGVEGGVLTPWYHCPVLVKNSCFLRHSLQTHRTCEEQEEMSEAF